MNRGDLWKHIELYQRFGFNIIPLRQRSKEPAVQWAEFQTRKSTEEELFRWFKDGEMNLGIVCGSVSGNLAVLDFDTAESYEKFFNGRPMEEETLVVKTSRGIHVYMKSSKLVKLFKIPELNLDVKGEGSYVVAPPSIHPSGVPYKFLGDPWSLEKIATVEDLQQFIYTRAGELGIFKHGSKEDPPCIRLLMAGVGEGMRNESAMRLASYWLRFKRLTADKVLNKLMEWNTHNRPPLDEKELKNCLSSILKYGYEYGCSSMVEFGVCSEYLKLTCNLRDAFQVKRQTVEYTASAILSDGRMIEEAYRDGKTFFIVYNPKDNSIGEQEEVSEEDIIYRPIVSRDVETGQVLLPSGAEEYETDENLFNNVRDFLNKWHEQPDGFERILDAVYVFLSWIHDALPQIPYRRAKGRWGSGKSAWIETVGSICYRPVILAGCDSEASLRRTFDLWRGTALIDEADFSESSLYASIVKILNVGYSKALGWYRCCNENNPRQIESFYVFGPKLLATRSEFKDIALESRCLTFIARKGSGEAPLYRAEQFRAEALKLRNKLLLWRFQNYRRMVEVSQALEKRGLFKEIFDGKVEPRVAQIILPLALVFENPNLRKALVAMAEAKSEEVRALDPDSWLEEEVPKAIRELALEHVKGLSAGELEVGGKSRILSQVDLVNLEDVLKVAHIPKKSQLLIPLKIREIVERLSAKDLDDSEQKSMAKKVSAFIRKQLGFIVKKSTGGYFYTYIPDTFIEVEKVEREGIILPKEHSLNQLNPLESEKERKGEKAGTEPPISLGDALDGYICPKCGKPASKVVKIRGAQEAVCDSCLPKISSVELALEERIKNARDVYRRLENSSPINMVEEPVFLEALKRLDVEPEALLKHLIEHGKVFRPKEGWIRWIGD